MKNVFYIIFSFFSLAVYAQKKDKKKISESDITIPLTADNWEFQSGKVQFENYDSRSVMKILPNAGTAVLKNTSFSNGTIEYDFIPVDAMFASLYFRWKTNLKMNVFISGQIQPRIPQRWT